jgi:hypothetical protein
VLSGLLSSFSSATTRIVPDDFAAIQEAMVASVQTGDTVLVRAGTYFENIDYLGKDVVLKSLDGPETTIVDATGQFASVVYMPEVGAGARLDGFTLTGGTGTSDPPYNLAGGGVHVKAGRDQGPVIENNWIIENTASLGGGIFIGNIGASGTARVLRNRIAFNEAGFEGGGVMARTRGSFPCVIEENEIFSNRVIGISEGGGGASLNGLGPILFTRNVVACNEASEGGGVFAVGSDLGITIEGNTIFANWGRDGVGGIRFWFRDSPLSIVGNAVVYNLGGGVDCDFRHGGSGLVECNDIYGNSPVQILDDDCGQILGENDNFNLVPLFGSVDCAPTESFQFCLLPDSPLLPGNSPPGCGLIGAGGACPWIGIADVEPASGADPTFLAARPNPFAERTAMPLDLAEEAEVRVDIVNARGGSVVELTPGRLSAGQHRIVWDGRDSRGRRCPTGVYFARIRAGDRELRSRLLLLR